MEQEKFQRFLEKTFEPTRQQFRRRAFANQRSYRWLLWGMTLCSAVSAIAVGWEAFFDWFPLKVFAGTITILVTLLAGALKTFGFQEKATLYSHHLNELNNEWDLFDATAGDYARADDPRQYFVVRTRAFLGEWAKATPSMTVPGDL